MENYVYAANHDSGDSPPGAREIDSENGSHHHPPISDELSHPAAAVAAPAPAPAPAAAPASRIKLMISYGGRIQPRPHDNQLAYVNGETKILSIDRSMRFPDFYAKLASVAGNDEICIKYQYPGEDLDALISITNNEDIDHMVIEYDRLHLDRSNSSSSSTSSRATPRVRVFLFPINPPPPSPALLEPKPERHWFVDALSSIPPLPPQVSVPPQSACNGQTSPDYLFGLDNTFVPPPAVKIKDPTPPVQLVPRDAATVEIPVKDDRQMGSDPSPNGSQAEIQRQIQELERLQLAENQLQQQPQSLPQVVQLQSQMQPQPVATTMSRNGSDESLTRAAILPKTQDKPSVPVPAPAPVQLVQQPTPQAPPATAVPQPTMTAPNGYMPRFQSIAGGDHQPVYVISHAPQGYFAAAPHGTASFVYAMPPPAPNHSTAGGAGDMTAGYAGAPVAAGYDNTGRAVYYTSVVPTAYHHQAVTNMALNNTEAPKPVKPSQVS